MASRPEEILAQLQSVGAAYAEKKPGAREQLMSLSHALISSLELPSEAILRMFFAEPARAAHCRIAVDLGLFDIVKASGADGIRVEELAKKAGVDVVLISRIMKHLAAMNISVESRPDTYVATPLSDAFTESKYKAGIVYTYDVGRPCFSGLPEYLKSVKYALPTVLTKGSFQAAHNTELPFFAWLDQNPQYLEAFNNYMAAKRTGKPSWVDPGRYPVSDRLAQGFDPSSSDVLLVDVGGGKGHDLLELKQKHPYLPGKLILQDRPDVVSAVSDAGNVFEPTSHDIFKPQPVKGARAYYLHSVLHNWGDDDCVRILEQLKPALRPGYSRVLINEIIVPDQNPPWPVTTRDQLGFIIGSMKERTRKDWENILERAGFRIARVYCYYEMDSECLIEAEIAPALKSKL